MTLRIPIVGQDLRQLEAMQATRRQRSIEQAVRAAIAQSPIFRFGLDAYRENQTDTPDAGLYTDDEAAENALQRPAQRDDPDLADNVNVTAYERLQADAPKAHDEESPFLSQFAASDHLKTDASEAGAHEPGPVGKQQQVSSPFAQVKGPYLTARQIADLDRALGSAVARGDSAAEQREIFELFKEVAATQGRIDRPDYGSAGSLQSFNDRIKSEVRLATSGALAREAEAYFSSQNALTRPGQISAYLAMAGEGGGGVGGAHTLEGTAILAGFNLLGALRESGERDAKPIKPIDPAHKLPEPITIFEDGDLKFPLYSEGQSRRLPLSLGLFHTFEGGDQREARNTMTKGQEFEAKTDNVMSDPKTGKRIVLAIGYKNDVTNGYNFLRIEGYIRNGRLVMPIDAKSGIPNLDPGRDARTAAERQISAAEQNGIKIIWEVPDRKTFDKANRELKKDFRNNAKSIRVQMRKR